MLNYDLEEYIRQRNEVREDVASPEPDYDFAKLCSEIKEAFFSDWENRENSGVTLEIQKRAIIGYEKEKNFFLGRIGELISELNAGNTMYPEWYESLTEAVYHENWGLAGLAEWFSAEWQGSSSAKIIGNNVFFMRHGRMHRMPQMISEERKEQLIKSFMLFTPEERMDKSYYELYLLDGTRVTVFTEPMAKKNQSSIIFRRYIIPSLSFEEQARRGTIPESMIPLFRSMVDIGYNVVFMGAVRTAKTTFLATWQSYEDSSLEGLSIETDPEIPLHNIMPGAPIIQLIADGDDLKKISKNILRSDADYFIMAEARDGIALDTALRVASKGTKRMKMTFHSRNPYHFPLEAAMEITAMNNGDLKLTMAKLAGNFDFLFHFVQLKDKSKKRLSGIYQMYLDYEGEIKIEEMLRYIPSEEKWEIKGDLSEDKVRYAKESDEKAYGVFSSELRRLSESRFIS